MGTFGRRVLFLWLTVLALAAGAAACGSNGNGSTFTPDASVGDGGSSGGDGATSDGPKPFGDGAGFGDGGAGQGTLAIDPPNPTLAITNGAVPTQAFTSTLTLDGVTQTVTSTWSLADYTLGTISAGGTFTPQGTIAGTATVIATYGSAKAQTTVAITVSLSAQLGSVTLPDGTTIPQSAAGISAPDMTALQAPPTGGDAGTPTTIIYPYDQTVFPLGLLAPVAEFSAGSVAPVDFKISLDTTSFHWDGFGHVGNPAQLQAAIPQAMWEGALSSATQSTPPASVVLSIVKAANGVAYGPAQAHLVVAPGQLTGIIYYESYSSDALPDGGGTDFGLWAVKPGVTQPPSHLQPGCVICHGVAASGNTITMGTDDSTVGGLTGVYRIEADGGYTHLATSPANLPYPITSIDSRGLGWGTNSPDGKVVLRALNQFWGGQTLLAWSVPGSPLVDDAGVVQPLSTTMTVNGDFNMFVPEYSVDGNHLVYVNATNPAGTGSAGAASQSIGIVDIATALVDGGVGGSVTLSNPRTIYDSTVAGAGVGAGAYTKVPTFLPDSKSVVFEETHSTQQSEYNYMLPDYIDEVNYVDGALAMLQPATGGGYVRVTLSNANAGSQAAFATQNYEPKPLPVQVGGYYWVVFASFRSDAYPTLGTPKKLWVTAISPGATPGSDPSHPPFTLVNQAIVAPQQSQRAYWALAPCQGMGGGCATDNDCCTGSCLPESDGGVATLVCGTPSTGCVATGSRCDAGQSQECCGAAQGVQCIGTLNGYGTCNAPGAAQ
jgi:hypothetical protein